MTTRIKPVHGIGDHIRRSGAAARCNTASKKRIKAAACAKTLVRCSPGSGRISSATSHNEEKAKKQDQQNERGSRFEECDSEQPLILQQHVPRSQAGKCRHCGARAAAKLASDGEKL